MKYAFVAVIIGVIGICAMAYAGGDPQLGKDDFLSSAISDVVDKVDKVASGNAKIFESVDDYEMTADGKRVPKRFTDKGKRTPLEEKLGE